MQRVKTAERHKRKLMFNEKGKYEEIGKQLRTKAKLQQLLQEIQVNPKKKNMLTDSRLALIQPKRVTTVSTGSSILLSLLCKLLNDFLFYGRKRQFR